MCRLLNQRLGCCGGMGGGAKGEAQGSVKPLFMYTKNRTFSDKCFLKETHFFSSLSKSSTRKWPCTESWSFLLGTSRSAAPHSGRKCTRQEPKAVKWPVRRTKNLLPSQGRRLLALFGNSYGGCMPIDIFTVARDSRDELCKLGVLANHPEIGSL